jgi:hypothetical protein
VIASVRDPDGRRVVLTEELHIETGHADLARNLRDIMAAVREPDRRTTGGRAGEEWFLAEGVGPGRWLQVVVHYEGGEGWIVTAFARRFPPKQ